jgi:hypothetical protein
MDEILKYLGTHFAQEIAVITGAPIISLITVCVLGAIMYFAMGAYYAHRLDTQHSIISLLRTRLEHGDDDSPTQPLPSLVPKTEQPVIAKPALGVAPPTTFIQIPKPKPAPLTSNIVAIRGQLIMLPENGEPEIDTETGVYRRRLRGFHAFVAIFHNLPLSERNIGPAQNVTASIVYEYKGLQFAQVTKGIWVEDNEEWRTNEVDFNPNSVRRLILAREEDKGQFFALEDYGDSRKANVLSNAAWGNGVPLTIPTGTQCRATVRFTISGRADHQKYRFNLGFGDNLYCGLEEDESSL